MADFVFKLSPNVILGNYSLARIGEETAQFGDNFMLMADPFFTEQGIVEKIKASLKEKNISLFIFEGLWKTSDSDVIERALRLAKGARIHGIIVCGGMITCAIGRAIATLYNTDQSIYKYIEGEPITEKPLPLIQIPSSFSDPFIFGNTSYLTDARNKNVCLLKQPEPVCKLVIFDPNIYTSFAPNTMNSMIFAGINLAFEGYTSTKSNFFSETILGKAIEIFLTSLTPNHEKLMGKTREELAVQAACLTALGTASSSPGVGTAITLAVSGRYEISDALVSTILLPHIITDAISSSLNKTAAVARMLGEESHTGADAAEVSKRGVEEIRRLIAEANLPVRLKDVELTIESLVSAAEDASKLSFMNYNPRPMSNHEIFEIIKQAF